MLHIYHGSGKGKTTAAFGVGLRAVGHHQSLLIIQFMKDGNSGEMQALEAMPQVTMYANKTTKKFYFQMNSEEQQEYASSQQQLWDMFVTQYADFDCVILDEVLDVMQLNILKEEDVLSIISTACNRVEIVMTGRNPSQQLQELSDYNTEMVAHKHPYKKGIPARVGVEF